MIGRIAKILKIDEGEVQRRLAYLNLSEEERKLLREISDRMSEEELASLFRSFYDHLLSFPETRKILTKEEGLMERLQKKQAEYFKQLLKANYDLNYALSRLHVGLVHEKVGVDAKYYTGAFSKWIESILPLVQRLAPKERLPQTLLALFKAVLLDITFSMDAYYFAKIIKGGSERYRAILDAVPDAIVVVDLETNGIADANRTAYELLGVSEEELIGKDALWVVPEEIRPVVEKVYRKAVSLPESFSEKIYLENKRTGEWIPVEVHGRTFEFQGKRFRVGVFRDIRERHRREEEIKRLNQLYDALSGINILVTTTKDKKSLFSEAVRIIGEKGNFKYAGIVDLNGGETIAEFGEYSENDTIACIKLEEVEGESYVLRVARRTEEAFTEQEVNLLHEIAHDLSFGLRRLKFEERISHLALYDELTDLPNRNYFLSKLKEYFDRAKAERKELALIIIDIDRFSEINEALGHRLGDELLREVARRLKSVVRESDFLGRIGADEFGVLVYSEDARFAVRKLIERIREAFREPVVVDSTNLLITFSYGISVYPHDVEFHMDLMTNAASAVLHAKSYGGNREIFYSAEVKKTTEEKLLLRTELRKALERREFVLYYQPKVNLQTGEVEGAEALIRWRRNGEIVPPYKFIPLIEKGELIHEVGEWVVKEACRQVAEWKSRGIRIPLAVNVSPIQVREPAFAQKLVMSIASCSGEYDLIEVEITESAVMEDISKSVDFINTLRSFGIKVYIDDFGTGYSSLAYLKKLPVYALKIDIEFIRDLPEDRDDLEIVKATIVLAKTFGLKTVAEGVETEEQAKLLKELGCDYAQGYYFAKPMPADEFEGFLRGFEWRT